MGKSRIYMKTIASIALSVVLAFGLLPDQAFAEAGDAVAAMVPQVAPIDMQDDASSAEPSIEPSIGSEGVDDLEESYSSESGENAFAPEEADEGDSAGDSSFISPESEEGIAPEAAEGSGYGALAVNSYAVLYDSDGDETGDKLVFQSSTLNLSKYGTKVNSWQFAAEQTKFTSSSPAPWYSARSTVKSVVFNNSLSPTTLSYWFYGMSSLESVDLSNLDASGATDMSSMFSGCSSLASLDLSSLDTSGVTGMSSMFRGCKALSSLDLSSLDTSGVTDMSSMFRGCKALASLDLTSLDTAKVTDMTAMFSGCSSLSSLDLSSFDTAKVERMGSLSERSASDGMFYDCSSLETVYAGPGFTSSAVTSTYIEREHRSLYYCCGMFDGCTKLKGGSGTTYSPSSTGKERARVDAPGAPGYFTDKGAMAWAALYDDGSLVFQAGTDPEEGHGALTATYPFNLSGNGTTTPPWSASAPSVKSVSFSMELSPSSMVGWFYGMSSLESVDLSNLDASGATDMSSMFSGCSSLASLDLSSLDTSGVTGMSSMFRGCKALSSLDLSSLDTSGVTDMSSMFRGCKALASLDLTSLDTAKVTDMTAMFSGCSSLSSLDLSSFDTAKVERMGSLSERSASDGMFYDCSSLETVYAGPGFTSSAVTSTYIEREHRSLYYCCGMFDGCTKLKGGSGTTYSPSSTGKERARVDAPGAPGYFTESCKPSEHTLVTVADEDKCEFGGESEVITMCSVCGREFSHETVNFTPGHISVVDLAVPATCLSTGLTEGFHCSRCGKVFLAQKVIPKTSHTAVVDPRVEPTCVKDGLTEGSHCSVCGQVIVAQEAIPSLGGHAYVSDKAVEPTCTQNGLTAGYHCSVCGEVFIAQEEVPAKGHTAVADAAVEPTCAEPGLTEGSHCSVCGEVLEAQETVPAKGHTAVTDPAVEPTCTEAGLTEGSHCSVCGEVIEAREEVPAKGHTAVGDAAVEPTCTEDGLTAGSHCSACGQVLVAQEAVPAKGHTVVVDPAVEPTCTEAGLTEGSHCSVCGEVISAQEAVPAKGHDWGEWKVVRPATADREGLKERVCARDSSHVETEAIKKLDRAPFPDVDYDSWYASGVTFVADKGLITGYAANGYFGVGDALTRGQLATILWRNACPDEAAAYDPAAARNETGLDGVSDGEYYTAAANWAVSEGVITGFEREDGTRDFAASSPVSFEQLITILSRLCADPGEVAAAGSDLSSFVDGADADVWASGALAWAASKGLVTGYVEPDGKYLRPLEDVTRERVAVVLMRAFELGVME